MLHKLNATDINLPSPVGGRGVGGEGSILLEHAKTMRANLTDAEQRLWFYLRAHRFMALKFKRQKPVGHYIVDFICFTPKLIVEVDGGQHADQVAYDRRRDTYLQGEGFTVLRFWNNQVLNETEAVLESIRQTVVALSPTHEPRESDCAHINLVTRKNGGFTLIEMVAVMALVSLMAGIALPAMQRWFDSISNRAQLSEVSIQFQRLASRAALLSQTVVLNKDSWHDKLSDGEMMLALPEGWSVTSTVPVTFYYSGVCTGGNVDLLGPQQRKVQLQIAPVSCDVSIVR